MGIGDFPNHGLPCLDIEIKEQCRREFIYYEGNDRKVEPKLSDDTKIDNLSESLIH